jgi:hypothetical protein
MKKTTLLSVFKPGNSTTNLHIALEMYKEHVVEAQGMQVVVVVVAAVPLTPTMRVPWDEGPL